MNMSPELQRLAFQLKHSFEGPAWHGPSLLDALSGVTPEVAGARPIPGAHTIWELLLHLMGTYQLVLRRLEDDGRQFTPDEDWPQAPEPTAANWRRTLDSLREANRQLRDAVSRFDPDRLDQPLIPDPPYTGHTQFIGVTQHNLYHAGQIAMLKKVLKV